MLIQCQCLLQRRLRAAIVTLLIMSQAEVHPENRRYRVLGRQFRQDRNGLIRMTLRKGSLGFLETGFGGLREKSCRSD